MSDKSIEVSIDGKWTTVPMQEVDGRPIIVSGRWIRMAAIHDEEWMETGIDDPELYVNSLRAKGPVGLGADIFTFTQKLSATRPNFDYPFGWDSIAVIRLNGFQDWWDKLPQETRKNVRRSAKRGVTVRVREFDEELIKEIAGVNNDSPVRQARPNKHYGKSLEQVKKDEKSFVDRSDFICAYRDDEMIGFVKVVYMGRTASILNLASKVSQLDSRPANALLAKTVEVCVAKGISHLTYGMFNYGNKRDSPLRQFKTRNGFEEILMPRFYVSLTIKGGLCMKLGLHRGLLGILPHSIITLAVNGRAKWYSLKNSISRCSSMVEHPNRNRKMVCSNPPAGSKT